MPTQGQSFTEKRATNKVPLFTAAQSLLRVFGVGKLAGFIAAQTIITARAIVKATIVLPQVQTFTTLRAVASTKSYSQSSTLRFLRAVAHLAPFSITQAFRLSIPGTQFLVIAFTQTQGFAESRQVGKRFSFTNSGVLTALKATAISRLVSQAQASLKNNATQKSSSYTQSATALLLKSVGVVRRWTQTQIAIFPFSAAHFSTAFLVTQGQSIVNLKNVFKNLRFTQAQQIVSRSSRALLATLVVSQSQTSSARYSSQHLINVIQAQLPTLVTSVFHSFSVLLAVTQAQVVTVNRATMKLLLYIANGIPPFVQGGVNQILTISRQVIVLPHTITITVVQGQVFTLLRVPGKVLLLVQNQNISFLRVLTIIRNFTQASTAFFIKAVSRIAPKITQGSTFVISIINKIKLASFAVTQGQSFVFLPNNIGKNPLFPVPVSLSLVKNIVSNNPISLVQAQVLSLLKAPVKVFSVSQSALFRLSRSALHNIRVVAPQVYILRKGYLSFKLWNVNTNMSFRRQIRTSKFWSQIEVPVLIPAFRGIKFTLISYGFRLIGSNKKVHRWSIVAKLKDNFFDTR